MDVQQWKNIQVLFIVFLMLLVVLSLLFLFFLSLLPCPPKKTTLKSKMLLILWDPLFPTSLIYNSDLGFPSENSLHFSMLASNSQCKYAILLYLIYS